MLNLNERITKGKEMHNFLHLKRCVELCRIAVCFTYRFIFSKVPVLHKKHPAFYVKWMVLGRASSQRNHAQTDSCSMNRAPQLASSMSNCPNHAGIENMLNDAVPADDDILTHMS